MNWETRGNGRAGTRRYYYRKVRRGHKVISEYVGRGELAEAIAAIEQMDAEEEQLQRETQYFEWKADQELDRELDRVEDIVSGLVTAVLLMNGYHTHRRQWRRAAIAAAKETT